MSDQQSKPKKSSAAPLATFIIILLVGVLYLGWSYLSGNLPWQKTLEEAEPKITWLEKEAVEKEALQPEAIPPTEVEEKPKLHLTPGEELPPPTPENQCLQTADKILLFFEHLDSQDYVRGHLVQGSSLDHFMEIINKLIANPPVVVRETDDLFAILNNMAHFFRTLGPKEILFVKDILLHERELIEPTMALFYKWSEIETECTDVDLDIKLPLAGLYEYAGYFINTLGGQSYLFRRELFLRVLLRYYSILIIDRANSVDANRYGIDIRYTLNSLISEVQANADLKDKHLYLENLIILQEEYQTKYGSN
jgi:hypothetical protein